MRLTLRKKIIATNLIVLLVTFLVVSVTVIEGLDNINERMLVNSLKHQAEISVISIRQSLMMGNEPAAYENQFVSRSRDFASKLSRDAGTRVLVFSNSANLLADSEGTSSAQPAYKELSDVLKGNRTYVIRSFQGSKHMHFSFPVVLNGSVAGAIMFVYPMQELDRNSTNIKILLVTAFAIGILLILIISLMMSASITKPVLQLKNSASEISRGNFKNRIDVKSSDEVGELANTFNIMSHKIESTITMINIERSKLDSVLESMGEGVIALDGSDGMIAVNPKAKSLINNCLLPEIRKIASKVREEKSRVVLEITIDGRNLLICATPLALDGINDGIVLILNDVTELRLLQGKQHQFLTNVSHELKTPLTTILGYIDLLKTKGHDRGIFDTCIHYLEDAGERLHRLVSDLLDLSCLDKFEFEVELKSTDVSALVKDIIGQMSLKAQKYGTLINTDIQQLPEILVDPLRIKQAVVNILDNAIKYSPRGEINVTLHGKEKQVQLVIADTGCGIPSEQLDKIFEPFYRVDKARSRALGGNGLGLAIAKEIVEKHYGDISIESREGKGTKVTVALPRQN